MTFGIFIHYYRLIYITVVLLYIGVFYISLHFYHSARACLQELEHCLYKRRSGLYIIRHAA